MGEMSDPQGRLGVLSGILNDLARAKAFSRRALCFSLLHLLGSFRRHRPLRFHRHPSSSMLGIGDKFTKRPSIAGSTASSSTAQQTDGECRAAATALLIEAVERATGKSPDKFFEPWRRRWEGSRRYREPVQQALSTAYNSVPRADLILTALGTTIALLAARKCIKRYRTAPEIPLDLFRRQARLRGFAINVNDSDNLRFYHTSPLTRFLRLRPNLKRTDVKYETINVRLAGIDAPEMAHFGGECQPYAREAKAWLTKFVEGRRVTLQLFRFDQYSRAVAAVYVGVWPFRKNVSVEMVRAGFADIYEDGGAEYGAFEAELRRHLKEAKAGRRGMWQQRPSEYISPSQYKKNLREATATSSANGTPAPPARMALGRLAFWK